MTKHGMAQRRCAATALLLAAFIANGGCAAPAPKVAPLLPIVATPITPAPPAPPEPLVDDGIPALDAALIERVPEGTFGPYVGTAPDGRSVAVWAALAEADGWRWFSAVLGPKGNVLAKPRSLAEAPSELSLATVAGTATGFVALATGVTPTGTRLEALGLGPTGELANGPTPLVHSRTEVLWVKALAVGNAAVALWATLAVGAADVFLAPLSTAGAQQVAPVRVLEGAKAWQAVEYSDGIALAAVIVGPNDASRTLVVTFLDSDGRVLGQTRVKSGASIDDQLEVARVGENLVLGWTEREGADERLYLAALGPDTHLIAPPEPALRAFGRQRLVELLPPTEPRGDALLAWELRGQAPRGQHRIQLGRVSERGKLEPAAATLAFTGDEGEEPELARKGRGLAALTRGALCPRDPAAPDAAKPGDAAGTAPNAAPNAGAPSTAAGDTPCTTPEPVPVFIELGPDLEPVASEPVRLAPEASKVADLAWGLHCSSDACTALGALPAAPVPIYGLDLRARSRSWPTLASRNVEALPRANELRAVADTDPLADVGATRLGNGWLVATLTQFDDSTPFVMRKTPAPDGKLSPVRALLSVQSFTNDGRAGARETISYRARATGGIAFTRLADDQALIAWTALDQQKPEVFTTLIDKTGASVRQRMLTKNAGDVSALAAAPLSKGSVVAWLSDRDGEVRLLAARLNEDLVRTAPEQRISAAGGFTGLSVTRRGDEPWLASSRREEREEVLSVTRLDPKTAARRGDELIIERSETSAISSPVIVSRGDGALLGWVQRPLVGGGEVARVWLVELDAQARPRGEPVAVVSQAGDPSALRLYCDGTSCQGAIDARPPDGSSIEAFDWTGAQAPESRLLAYRASASADLPAFAITESAVFLSDRIEQRGLLRRLGITWR